MARIGRLLVALVAAISAWGALWLASSARAGRCNPDDLTTCDALGSILLFLLLVGLPVVLLALLLFVVLDAIALRERRTRSSREKDP